MMGDFFQRAVIFAKWGSRFVIRAQYKNDASRLLTHWIPAVARMTAVGDGGAK